MSLTSEWHVLQQARRRDQRQARQHIARLETDLDRMRTALLIAEGKLPYRHCCCDDIADSQAGAA